MVKRFYRLYQLAESKVLTLGGSLTRILVWIRREAAQTGVDIGAPALTPGHT